MTSGSQFGSTDLHDDHLMERLNSYVGNLSNEEPFASYDRLTNVQFPTFDGERFDTNPSDILLRDVFRQNGSLEEKFRKGQFNLQSIRMLADPATRFHLATARGFERDLVKHINGLDTEMMNRQTIVPAGSVLTMQVPVTNIN